MSWICKCGQKHEDWANICGRCDRERKTGLVRILSLLKLREAASKRKSLTGAFGMFRDRPKPAAVILNMTGHIILRMLETGLYVYEKKEPKAIDTPGNSDAVEREVPE